MRLFYYYFENFDDTKERYTNESVIYEVDDGYVVAHAIQFHNREAWEEEKKSISARIKKEPLD